MVCGLISVANRMVSSIVSRGLARQPEDEGAVDHDAELVAVLGEASRDVDAHALLDVVQDLLVAGFVADQQQPQPVVRSTFSVSRGTLALALHDQVTPSLPSSRGDRLGARPVVGEGVVVEEELLHLREGAFAPRSISSMTCPTAAGAVAVAADGLRPQAEGAARFAAAAGVEREIGVLADSR